MLAGDEDIEIIPFFVEPDPTLLAGDEDIEIIPFFIKSDTSMLVWYEEIFKVNEHQNIYIVRKEY